MAHSRTLITAALPYANGPLHIGHLAGAYLPADVYARFLRLKGEDVVYVCGSDEHGAAITMRAMKEGISPQEIIDKYHHLFEATFAAVGIKFDIFHRTSAPIHHQTSQDFFSVLYKNNQFLEINSEQYYDAAKDQFLADRYIIGTCPVCASPEAYGDQCEKCGSTLSPTELISPRSTLSGETPVLRETRHWYLPLDRYTDWLRNYIEKGELEGQKHHDPAEWKAHVIGQCKSWIDSGLHPRAMTRDLDWGVDVPKNIPGHEGKKLYVWMDAPIGYISATKQWCLDHGQDWRTWWQDDTTRLLHFIGKDNIVFHCLIFPAMLKVHGAFNLPTNVPANQFMNLEGRKISTSRNWAVWVHEFVESHPLLVESLRYYMIKNMPENRDSEFTWRGFQEANNNELVNNLANFVHRVMVLNQKYYNGLLPAPALNQTFISPDAAATQTDILDVLARINVSMSSIAAALEKFELRAALLQVMELSSMGNLLLQINEPWKQQNTNPTLVATVMAASAQVLAALAIVVRPFLPGTSDRLRAMLNLAPVAEKGEWTAAQTTLETGKLLLSPGIQLQAPEHLFTRIADEWVQTEIEKLSAMEPTALTQNEAQSTEIQPVVFPTMAPEIVYDDFGKLDLRVGRIVSAVKVPKADKLLQLEIDLGFEKRTVVSGIAEHYAPEAIIGQQVVLVANLAPRKLRGIESQGMILMAENASGQLCFVAPTDTKWPEGFVVK